MLKIKHKKHFSLPHFSRSSRSLSFEIVREDADELSLAIAHDNQTNDNQWELNERPDGNQLVGFWSDVENDIAKDPEWVRFAED